MKFQPIEAFRPDEYRLLPFRFRRLPWDRNRVLASSWSGDWIVLNSGTLERLVSGTLPLDAPEWPDLESRHFVIRDDDHTTMAPLLSQSATRKHFLTAGPALHLFVVSLRCHHSCAYCQVSRQPAANVAFDMSEVTAQLAVDRLFEWPAPELTVEFQGGEPLLHFERVRSITESIVARNQVERRRIQFVLASTLHDLTVEQLAFFAEHQFHLSTSLDGPEALHNANRPRPEHDSHSRTLRGIDEARRVLGEHRVAALTTLTARSLETPEAIVDEYRRVGFHTIVLRPLSPYGFAVRSSRRTGYTQNQFLSFYRRALDHILAVNRDGYVLEEGTAALLLSQLATPFGHGYVDLRSPTGAGFGAVVYDYDGQVYPADEARMLAAMGDKSLALGTVQQSIQDWMSSPAMRLLADAGVAEALPSCADCAYVPWCGADPVDHYARQGDRTGHRPTSEFCTRQLGLFDQLLERLIDGPTTDRSILQSWAVRPRKTA